MDFLFLFNSLALGVGLAMDAFSVSLANGLNEPNMHRPRALFMASVFGIMQGLMPLIGWVLVHTLLEKFKIIELAIPYIALALLGYIGVKMLLDGIKEMKCAACSANPDACKKHLTVAMILVQGVATSIDALSVGFTIADYDLMHALIATLIIAAVTTVICTAGVYIGKRCGTALAGKSSIFGGIILIFIGLEIFITSFL
jgi:putative Mn2+ efflux pump MntP